MMTSPDKLRLAGVIGNPIGHSLSPVIHREWADRENANAYYIPIATDGSEADFVRAVTAARDLGLSGVNVTAPHKEHALRFADTHSETAESVQAANMLSFIDNRTYADNSDVIGFANACRPYLEGPQETKAALLIGAGGAARGVAAALLSLNFDRIFICNRTLSNAESLAQSIGDAATVIPWKDYKQVFSSVSIIVNTTTLGMAGAPPLPLDLNKAPRHVLVSDIIYKPLKTNLILDAEQRGLATMDGLAMLMHQAVPGYKAWLGAQAVVDAPLRALLEETLKKREAP
ncbi:MAG: shikimate dehydrogenase [Pseudomonadota bacterium]